MDTGSQRHAYLIIAHNNFAQLQTLLSLLDDSRNDIYLHIDKKSRSFRPEMVHTRHAGLILIPRISVFWGGYSQIQCELNLLKAALPGNYRYYHLLSGQDLPLKSQDQIHSFFREQDGAEFIEFDDVANREHTTDFRFQYYHFLIDPAGRFPRIPASVLRTIERKLWTVQRRLGIRRPTLLPIYKGTNWFSITHSLAAHIVSREDLIRRQFSYSWCGDELFLQSIAMDSPCREKIVNNCLRAIDWERGEPYIYHKEDVPQLLSSP